MTSCISSSTVFFEGVSEIVSSEAWGTGASSDLASAIGSSNSRVEQLILKSQGNCF